MSTKFPSKLDTCWIGVYGTAKENIRQSQCQWLR